MFTALTIILKRRSYTVSVVSSLP